MLNPLYPTIDAHGHDHIINLNHVSHIKHSWLKKKTLSPCGPKDVGCIRVVMTNGSSILIACDLDGGDITEDFVNAYCDYFHQCHKHTTLKSTKD